MNDILTENAKSFRIIRPKTKSGTLKPMVTYTSKFYQNLYLNIGSKPKDTFDGLNYLFGPDGVKKSFQRYYFPKRYIWQSTLYLKPRVMTSINAKEKTDEVNKNLKGFRGYPKNKIIDQRNCILDFSDIFSLVVPTEKHEMIKSEVVKYVNNIYPELICYILFANKKHDKKNDVEETSKEDLLDTNNSLESSHKYNISRENLKEVFNENYELPIEFNDMSDEEWNVLVNAINRSIEDFTEKLMAKTSVFSMSGPGIGLDQYGFDKFIIGVPFTIKALTFVGKQYIQEKIALTRNIKINPELVYQITILQFINRLYSAYFNGSSSEEFIAEMIKHNITFHIYSPVSGTGFCINLKELKTQMKFRPDKFLNYFVNRLQLLVMCNTGVITDNDLDKVEKEDIKDEVDRYYLKESEKIKTLLKKDVKEVVESDIALQTVLDAKKKEIKEKVIKSDDKSNKPSLDEKINHFIPTKQSLAESNSVMKTLQNLEKTFARNEIEIKSDKPEENPPINLTDEDYADILADTSDIEDIPDDNITGEDKDNIVEEVYDESKDIDGFDMNDESRTSDTDSFLSDFNEFKDDVEEEDEEEDESDFVEIKPKDGGPIKLKPDQVKKVHRSPADIKRIEALKEKYKSITIDNEKIETIIGRANNITIDENIPHNQRAEMKNENSNNANVVNFQRSYVKKNYQADIINAVHSLSINKADPLYMTNVDVEDTSTQFTDKYTYTFTLEDEFKRKHNISFDVPKINDFGMIKIGGNTAYIKKQLIRLPICKIGPDKVYITTELNSYQVSREGLLLNRSTEIMRRLISEYLANHDNIFIERGNATKGNKRYLTTLEYDILANNYFLIRINNEDTKFGQYVEIYFSQETIRDRLRKHPDIKTGFPDNKIPDRVLPIGINYTTKTLYYIDLNTKTSVSGTIIGILMNTLEDENEELLNFIKQIKTPKRRLCSKIEIQDKIVPLITFLNYLFGWDRVKTYFSENELEFSEKPIKNTQKLAIKFYDGWLYYNQYPLEGALLINGLTELNTENFLYEDLAKQEMYMTYTFHKYNSRNIVKGWVTAKETMIDLKTLQILKELNLPTDLLEIFLYCNFLLTDNQVKDESDITNYRIRSNEIISEYVYKVVNQYYTAYKKRAGKKLSMAIPQNAIMSAVQSSQIMDYYTSINPIGEIRAMGLTTFKGPGGTKVEQAFTIPKRAYNDTYYGIFGWSTPDNFNAGIVKELTINPNIINTLGLIGKTDKPTSLNDIGSISEALVPFVNNVDDPSRVAFVSTQNAHVGGMMNASLPPVRTGVEKIIKNITSETFIVNSKEDGVIEKVDEVARNIYVKYKDGTKDVVSYNNKILKNGDIFNTAIFDRYVKEGQKIKKGDILVGDKRFFKIDPLSHEIIYTQAISGMFTIMENGFTEDDSNALTSEFASRISTDITHRRQISISVKDSILEFKKIGDKVLNTDFLMVYDTSGIFSEEEEKLLDAEDALIQDLKENISEELLTEMLHQTPNAEHTGVITDMKVYWVGKDKDMSPSVRKFISDYRSYRTEENRCVEEYTDIPSKENTQLVKTDLELGKNFINGAEVDPEYGLLVEYFISEDNIMGTGDKVAINSSLKTVNAEIISKNVEPFTETGYKVDGIFSWISQNARMVNSIWYNGFIGKILYIFTKRWANNFLKEIGYEKIPELNRRKIKYLENKK